MGVVGREEVDKPMIRGGDINCLYRYGGGRAQNNEQEKNYCKDVHNNLSS